MSVEEGQQAEDPSLCALSTAGTNMVTVNKTVPYLLDLQSIFNPPISACSVQAAPTLQRMLSACEL